MKTWWKVLLVVTIVHCVPCLLQLYSSALCPVEYEVFNFNDGGGFVYCILCSMLVITVTATADCARRTHASAVEQSNIPKL
jgi:hypothetical protein